jgi:RNA polymerase sigma-70 factor (ECF subfamily)
MSTKGDKTFIGGKNEWFQATCWTNIRAIRTISDEKRTELVNQFIQNYWKPVYCFLRQKGCPNETAKDLTQGFFCEIVLGKNLLVQADEHKGKFRTFLLRALQNYCINVNRDENIQRRSPAGKLLSLNAEETGDLLEEQSSLSPDDMFNYTWALNLIEEVIEESKTECLETHKERHWQLFEQKVLQPILDSLDAPSNKILCEQYGIEDETKVSNMILTVKRRFQKILYRRLGTLVDSEDQIEKEYAHLCKILTKSGAR